MSKIYLFSGLGADKSVFDNLSFLKKHPHQFIEWEDVQEIDLEKYALQLSKQIQQDERVILIGVSFGGMLAASLANLPFVDKVILISSVQNSLELPFLYRLVGNLKLYKLLPHFIFTYPNRLLSFLFGVFHTPHEKQLYTIIRNTDTKLAKKFVQMILTWKSKVNKAQVIKIHGKTDRIIPYTTSNYCITNGGHFMILTHSTEIDEILHRTLD